MSRMPSSLWWIVLAGCTRGTPAPTVPSVRTLIDEPVPVEVVEVDGRWQVRRGGSPYTIRGAGYSGELHALVAAGGTTLRTWGVGPDTPELLDRAHEHGLTVVVGLWMGHVEHGFDYADHKAVAEQLEALRGQVRGLRGHPALLMWGVGNEVELEGGDDPRIWRAIEDVAAMVHAEDPLHPTIAVTAELGEAIDQRLATLCPSVDVWGINSYGGALSVPERLTQRGFAGPWALTELGPHGDWERPRHPWGAAVEQTSTDKAAAFAPAIAAAASDPRSVGTFAFLWGPAERPLDTWYALFGPGGLRYEGVDALQQAWRGKAPENRAPRVAPLLTDVSGAVLEPGAPVTAALSVTDDDDDLQTTWVLHPDVARGAGAPVQCVEGEATSVTWTAPAAPGPYRLLGVVQDPAGGAAYASARFHVGDPGAADRGTTMLPTWVDGPFAPSGWMGDATEGGLVMEACDPRPGFCGGPCRRFVYDRKSQGWAGVVWHHPDQNWKGRKPGVRFVTRPSAVTFTAWGDRGGEYVTFASGNRGVDGFEVSDQIALTTEPTLYRLELAGADIRDVAYGFSWTVGADPTGRLAFQVADVSFVP